MLVFSLIAGMFAFMIPMTQAQAEGRTFTVGFDAEFPPYGYKDNSGEYVGFDLDLAQEVCSRNGWTLRKQPIVWDTKDSELNSGSIDCIWNGFTINGREDKYTWSDAYVDNSQVVIVRKDSEIKKLSDLAGKTVLVQADSSALAAFQGEDATDENKQLASSFKTLRQSADYNTAFMELESGMADAVCLDYGVANYQLSSRGDTFRMLDEKVSTEQYGIGFKLGNTELRDQVQAALYAMKKDGKFDEIAKKWGLQDSVILQVPDSGEGSKEPQTSKTDDDSEKGRRMDIKVFGGSYTDIEPKINKFLPAVGTVGISAAGCGNYQSCLILYNEPDGRRVKVKYFCGNNIEEVKENLKEFIKTVELISVKMSDSSEGCVFLAVYEEK